MFLITNRHLVSEEKYFKTLEEASRLGVNNIILREKDLSDYEFLNLYRKIKALISEETNLIINSNINVFNMVNEEIIHLPFKVFKENFQSFKGKRIGVSIHSLEEAKIANELGAYYVMASPIFETQCKPGAKGKGIKFIRDLRENIECKIVALGGIDENNFKSVIESGADDFACMSLLFKCEDVEEILKLLE